MSARVKRLAIVGVGLIGGSIGLAARACKAAETVVGIGRDPRKLREAIELGAIDQATTDWREGLAGALAVVICSPVSIVAADAVRAAGLVDENGLITDAGSTKSSIVARVEADPRGRRFFVGAHPIAGSERQGVAHARADLFQKRVCVLTPTEKTPRDRLAQARSFWESLGCRVVERSPEAHDEALAWSSHLPHVAASALAGSVPIDALELAAGAYRDGSRVALADAELWSAILLDNRASILRAIDGFNRSLADLRDAIDQADADRLRSLWNLARNRRLRFAFDSDSPAKTDSEPTSP